MKIKPMSHSQKVEISFQIQACLTLIYTAFYTSPLNSSSTLPSLPLRPLLSTAILTQAPQRLHCPKDRSPSILPHPAFSTTLWLSVPTSCLTPTPRVSRNKVLLESKMWRNQRPATGICKMLEKGST